MSSSMFRSNLMQQFASSARNQSRPPMALATWLAHEQGTTAASAAATSSGSQRRNSSGPWPTSSTSSLLSHPPHNISNPNKTSTSSSKASSKHQVFCPVAAPRSSASSSATMTTSSRHDDDDEEHEEFLQDENMLASQFQTLLQTRRTTSRFESTSDSEFFKEALDRAVACGQQAPNHKLTEPIRYARLLAPSPATERLAEIAYQTSLQKSNDPQAAESKRAKWQRIPAFLVAMVQQEQIQTINQEDDDDEVDPYRQLPFVPATTERGLEDYAAACASVQNIMLSLHAEHLGTKWATGPVIRTQAFRDLVHASPYDRIVALIMVGVPASRRSNRRRFLRRQDTIEDL